MIKADIFSLLKAQKLDVDRLTYLMSLPTISKILDSFAVGTERSKINIPPVPKGNEILSLCQISTKSVVSMIKEQMNLTSSNIKKKTK